MTKRDFSATANSIGAIYHAAAAVDWVRPYRDLRDANVLGTRELLRSPVLARQKLFTFFRASLFATPLAQRKMRLKVMMHSLILAVCVLVTRRANVSQSHWCDRWPSEAAALQLFGRRSFPAIRPPDLKSR
jgi:hypothetical protein